MPELPEVETVVCGLRPILVGQRIEQLEVFAPPRSIEITKSVKSATLRKLLEGQIVESIDRRGKNILIHMQSSLVLWVHLKMTGQFRHVAITEPRDTHDLFVMTLQSTRASGYELRFNDYRRFGRWRLLTQAELASHPSFRTLGPEPLDISAEEFRQRAMRVNRQIKAALLDQSFLAGVGNIYADESLWASRIHPLKPTRSIAASKLTELHSHIQRLLKLAIKRMGTSVDSYRGVNGQVGSNQSYLKVYGREDQPCNRCGKSIRRITIGSRSAHLCVYCQRLK
jgi:formamidopyrimidine-DNA glycosylase